jgi:hypothetical protein
MGFSPRLGFQLREDLNLQLRYSISQQEITLPDYLTNCNNLMAAATILHLHTMSGITGRSGGNYSGPSRRYRRK